jgi:gliding motility-associated-like protein
VADTGVYSVRVSDASHCKGTGTLYISKMIAQPAHFLPQDTAICNYGDLLLTSKTDYPSYLWSTGSSTKSITTASAGWYWLQVTDAFNCSGTDSVQVTVKECMKGLYVPTAFTPNQDGKNDRFKPLVFGNVLQFKWTVYNRFGQAIFTSSNPAEGWNGTYKGLLQEQGNYVWKCSYQLAGEEVKQKSGSVMLIR